MKLQVCSVGLCLVIFIVPTRKRRRDLFTMLALMISYLIFATSLNAQSPGNNPPPLVQPCENTTFTLRLKGNAGEKVQLANVRTNYNGNYLLGGTVTLSDNTSAAMLTNLANDGSVLSHFRFKVDNSSCRLTDLRILPSGEIISGGILNDGSNRVFLNRLNADFSVAWQTIISTSALPQELTLELVDNTSIAMAVQMAGAMEYAIFQLNGNNIFSHRIDLPNTTDLVSFGLINNLDLGIVTNELYLGKPGTRVTLVDKTTGVPGTTTIQGGGIEEMKTFGAEMMGSRLHLTGLRNNATKGFYPFRTLIFLPENNDGGFDYQAATPLNFNVSGAKDPYGDAMAYFNPSNKKLLFFNHFNQYAPAFTFTRSYDLPEVSTVQGIARSFDGGYLVALNSTAQDVVFLLKTDSTGTAYGCGAGTVTMSFTQVFQSTNGLNARSSSVISLATASGNQLAVPGNLSSSFDCKQTYCPPAPLKDECLPTYYKTFRSGSYIEIPRSNMLFSNNRQIIPFIRQDRIFGATYIAAYGLKMMDEKGRLLKAVDMYQGTAKVGGSVFRADTSHLVIAMGDQVSLVDDNMNILWTRRIMTTADAFTRGMAIGSVHRDDKGNVYVLYVGGDVFDPVKLAAHKLDPSGNHLWSKAFTVNTNFSLTAAITTTPAGVVIIGEAPEGYTMLLNRDNGTLLKTHRFDVPFIQNNIGITERLFAWQKGRLLYSGQNGKSHLTMGILDSTGRPLRFQTMPGTNVYIGADMRDGFIYMSIAAANAIGENVLIKIDSDLKTVFSKGYMNSPFSSQRGLTVSPDGSIYTSGTILYMNSDQTIAYLRKYDKDGNSGDCVSRDVPMNFVDVPFTVNPMLVTPAVKTYNVIAGVLDFQPVKSQFNLADVLCSSKDLCSTVKLNDPGKICQVNTDVTITYATNVTCNREPIWLFDNTLIKMQSSGLGKAVVHFLKPGNGLLIARMNTLCGFYDDTLQLEVDDKPVKLNLGKDTLVCDGNSLILSPGAGFSSYKWQDGSTSPQYNVTQAGKYWVNVADQDNCSATDTIMISAGTSPSGFLAATDSICRFGKLVLIPVGQFASYHWSDGTKSNTTTVSQAGTYSLEVTDMNGCRSKESMKVIQVDCRNAVFIPTAFTPNKDGINDVFRATVFGGVREFLLVVYNRYGQVVFTTNDPYKPWDGYFNGKPADVGNFVWRCSYKLEGSESVVQKGSVVLLR